MSLLKELLSKKIRNQRNPCTEGKYFPLLAQDTVIKTSIICYFFYYTFYKASQAETLALILVFISAIVSAVR